MVMQLIYASEPFGFDEAMLNGILVQARRNNPRHDVTGALICRHDLYLQLVEGPDAAIEALYAKIRLDNRHLAVNELHRSTGNTRLFPKWAMYDDPADSWVGSVGDLMQAGDARSVFESIAREVAAAHPVD